MASCAEVGDLSGGDGSLLGCGGQALEARARLLLCVGVGCGVGAKG